MASLRQCWSIGPLLPFTIAAVLCTSFCFNVILNPNYQRSGLITILFDFTKISRNIALSIPSNPNAITGVISTVPTQAQSVESAIATVATGAVGEANSAVTSALSAIETAVGSVPKNCTLGVKSFCIGFADHIDCQELSLNVSKIIPSSVAAIGPINFESLDQVLAILNTRSLRVCLALGLFAIIPIFPDIISLCSLLAYQRGFTPSFWMPAILAPLRAMCTALCCIPLLFLVIILFLWKSANMPKEINVEAGKASGQIVAAFICVIFMGVSIVVGWHLDRQIWGFFRV